MKKSDNIEQLKEYFATNQLFFEDIRYSVGTKLLNIRKKQNYTQQEVADIIGISRSALSYYEKGERAIDIITLYKLCNLYNVSADYLLGTKSTPDTQYDYAKKMELSHFGFSDEALAKVYGSEDTMELFNDLVLHPNFQELQYLTYQSRYTRYESVDSEFRAFMTSKLLYSMMADIFEQWYVENDERIKVLSTEEKEKLLSSIEEFKEKRNQYRDQLNSFGLFDDFDKLETDLDEMWNQIEMLYKKLKQYI